MSIEIEKPERFYEHARRSIDAYRYSFFLNKEDTFRVLCGKFHVVTMTKALWIYHLVSIILVTITFFYEYLIYLWPTWLLVFFSGYPIYRQKASWMWPFIIYVGLTTVMFILFGAYLFFYSIFIRRTQKTVVTCGVSVNELHFPRKKGALFEEFWIQMDSKFFVELHAAGGLDRDVDQGNAGTRSGNPRSYTMLIK
ncbi:hypothetical protein FO519_006779 [Halicephalobus sp. NKZ332]|nr:hypothetical protein FO519_006779 [Halicephalobus sp. NKZ332]